ncbi:hypothetical protein D3C72_1233330 [compost metagenome]
MLLGDEPVTVTTGVLFELIAGDGLGVTIAIFQYVIGVGRALVIAQPIFSGQCVDRGAPNQLNRYQRAFGSAATELEAVSGFQIRGVLLEDPDLCIPLGSELVACAQGPLADRPVEPNVANPVCRLGAAERRTLEVARETVEVRTFVEAAKLQVQRPIQPALTEPHLRQAPGLPAAINFLARGVASHSRISDAIVGQVAPVTLGDGELELRMLPTEDFLQVGLEAQRILLGPARRMIFVITAAQIGGHFPGVTQFDINALIQPVTAYAIPVTGHPA